MNENIHLAVSYNAAIHYYKGYISVNPLYPCSIFSLVLREDQIARNVALLRTDYRAHTAEKGGKCGKRLFYSPLTASKQLRKPVMWLFCARIIGRIQRRRVANVEKESFVGLWRAAKHQVG